MRKEILGVVLVFALIFSSVSLLSYHPADPSINHAGASDQIHNLFGPIGAHVAGFLIFLCGFGAYWVPVVLLIVTVSILKEYGTRVIVLSAGGGILLMFATGALLALCQAEYVLFGSNYSQGALGGVVGIPLAAKVGRYGGATGGLIFLFTIWTVAFIMTTRVSLIALFKWFARVCSGVIARMQAVWILWAERRAKARRRAEAKEKHAGAEKAAVKVIKPGRKPIKELPRARQEAFEFMPEGRGFKLPSVNLLEDSEFDVRQADDGSLRMQSQLLEKKLSDFDVSGKVVAVSPGPVVTMYEYEPAAGVKINKVVSLTDDLAMALRATSIRIVAPIPGKAVIGIEVANADREPVRIKEIIASPVFDQSKSRLTLALGKDILGQPVVTDLAKMPHLLIAGATGAGKSVALNAMICSVLYKASPEEVKFLMIDPKRIELATYEGIPHMISPVVLDARKATQTLLWAVREMERRYALMAEKGVRNISRYQQKYAKEQSELQRGKAAEDRQQETEAAFENLPYIIVVIDELADLMLVASRDVEKALTRLAQMARAAGIHLLIATQRPSVDVLTGIIKANFPARISFQVSSRTDSRTILDSNGAETLLGNGDMLLLPPGSSKLQRIHGAFISEAEIGRVSEFLKNQQKPVYEDEVLKAGLHDGEEGGEEEEEYDDKYDEAVELVTQTRQASISMIQRRLRVGYNRAARMIEMMERDGVVGPSDGSKPREVLAKGYIE